MLEATVEWQEVTSPDFSGVGYPINTDAMWIISAPVEFDVITVMISSLSLNEGDEFRIYDGSVRPEAMVLRIEGPIDFSATQDYYSSTTDRLMVGLITTSVEGAQGFSLRFKLGQSCYMYSHHVVTLKTHF